MSTDDKMTIDERRKYLRLMKWPLIRKQRRKQRGRTYGPQVDDALRVIAESLDYVCAERLTPNLDAGRSGVGIGGEYDTGRMHEQASRGSNMDTTSGWYSYGCPTPAPKSTLLRLWPP